MSLVKQVYIEATAPDGHAEAVAEIFKRAGFDTDVQAINESRGAGEVTTWIIQVALNGDTLEAPDDEAVRAVVGLFRLLYNDHEPTSYAAIIKLVSRHAHERQSPQREMAVDQLGHLRKLKTRALQEGMVTYAPSGRALTPQVLIETFINGHYLHKDERRMAVLEDLRADVVVRFEFLSTLQRLTHVFWIGHSVVQPILETPELLPRADDQPGK